MDGTGDRDEGADMSSTVSMDQLGQRIAACTLCPLALSRIRTVPGEGPVPSAYLFVGEAPGRTEDETGRPFVGRAGKILSDLLASCSLSRDEVFITSVVKCRPPGNRAPRREEINSCLPYLEEQVSLLSPRFIVPMGRHATMALFGMYMLPFPSFGDVRGREHVVREGESRQERIIVPVLHPAVATHNPPARRDLESDFQKLARIIHSSR
jgi:DNA polymerase